jgi:DNA-directed RNA polymerase specialized sigma24 family protein
LPEGWRLDQPARATSDKLDRHRLVRIALDALPERQRLALVLVYHQDLRDREAAELMGTSVEAFEFLMARAEGSGGGSTR